MKKVLLFLSIILLSFSCTGPMGPEGPRGPQGVPGEDGNVGKLILDYTINSNDWERITDSNGLFLYYQYVFDEFEIDDYIYNDGVIVAYLEVAENNYTLQKPLPYIINNEDSQGNIWFQTIEYDYGVESICFYVKNSDFREDRPGNLNFRVAFVW